MNERLQRLIGPVDPTDGAHHAILAMGLGGLAAMSGIVAPPVAPVVGAMGIFFGWRSRNSKRDEDRVLGIVGGAFGAVGIGIGTLYLAFMVLMFVFMALYMLVVSLVIALAGP